MKDRNEVSIKSLKFSIFRRNRILNFFYHYPDQEIQKDNLEISNLKIVFIKTSLFSLIIPFIIFLITSWNTNTLFIEGEGFGYFEDYSIFTQLILFNFVLLFSYVFFENLRRFFLRILPILDINSLGEDEYYSYLQKKSEFVNGEKKFKHYKYFFYGIGLLGMFWWIFPFKRTLYNTLNLSIPLVDESWRVYCYSPQNSIILMIFYILFIGFILLPLMWRLLASVLTLNKFCKELMPYIKLKTLSPDDVGGLSPLGEITLNFHFIILSPIILFIVSIYTYGVTGATYIGIGYFIILIVIFFLPLLSAHDIMQKHKKTILHKLSEKYNFLNNELESYINNIPSDKKELEIIDKMEKLRNYYRGIKKMPVWPFNFSIMSRFIGSIIFPFLLLLLERYI